MIPARPLLIIIAICLIAAAAHADGEEPLTLRASQLPPALRALHAPCAAPGDLVSLATDRIGTTVLFFVSCPRESAESWPADLKLRFDPTVLAEAPVAVYVAGDGKGRGAIRLSFPALVGKTESSIATLPANAEADREAKGPPSPWIVTLWKPDHPGMCKIRARWKIVAKRAELWRWEEAPRCTADDGPVYRTILDRHAPRLSRE